MMNVAIKYRIWLAGLFLSPMLGISVAAASELSAEVWKDPNCGCCKEWIQHLEEVDIQVRTSNTGNTDIRERLGIARQFGSCHTARIGGYAIEGHVPVADIKRLLKEKPEAIGLAVPGMPIGSPGMDGPLYGDRKDPYDVSADPCRWQHQRLSSLSLIDAMKRPMSPVTFGIKRRTQS